VFSSLGARVPNSRVLDLFSGSGSLAIEALSRGAESAVLVERDRGAVAVIESNLALCGFEARVVKGELAAALDRIVGEFDLVFVDPPYGLALASVFETISAVVPLLSEAGLVVLHRRREAGVLEDLEAAVDGLDEDLIIEDHRAYGDSLIVRLAHNPAKGDR